MERREHREAIQIVNEARLIFSGQLNQPVFPDDDILSVVTPIESRLPLEVTSLKHDLGD